MAGTWSFQTLSTNPYGGMAKVKPAIVGNKIYYAGRSAGIADGLLSTDLVSYDLITEQWATVSAMPTATIPFTNWNNMYVVYHPIENKLYVFGVFENNAYCPVSLYYDLSNGTWGSQIKTSGISITSSASAGAYYYETTNTIYMSATTGLYSFDTITQTFTAVNTTNSLKIGDATMIGILGKIYFVGGTQNGVANAGIIEYNITTNVAVTKPIISGYTSLARNLAWNIGTDIYVAADNSHYTALVHKYNVNTEVWTSSASDFTITNIPVAAGTGAITKDGKTYIMGGAYSIAINNISAEIRVFSYFLDKPTTITAQYNNNNTITLSWSDNSNEETHYIVERKSNVESIFSTIATITATESTSYSYIDTTADVLTYSYEYRIKARKVVV